MRREWLAMGVLTLPVLLISLDMTVLGAALPAISADLAPSGSQQLWIVDVYSFVLAGLLIVAGSLGDRIGRRRLLLAGAAAFGVASALAAFAPTAETLIAARALLGIGGATLMPSTLSLIKTLFPDARRRATAVAIWSAAFSGGAAAGPVLGGWLLEHFWWGSVFLLGVPVTLVLLVLGPVLLPESRDPHPGPFDLLSAALSLAAMLPVVSAIKTVATEGVTTTALVAAVVGVAAGVAFVHRQRTLARPMIDLGLLANPRFSVSVLTNLLGVFALVGLLVLLPQHLQLVLGLTPLDAALWMLPGTVAGVVGALVATRLARAFPVPALIGAGLVVAGAGIGLLAAAPGLVTVVIGFALAGGGIALSESLTNDLVLAAAPADRAGAASAISETGYELGGALGTAVLGSVTAAVFTAAVPGQDTLGGALARSGALGPPAASALADAARGAFTAGLQVAAVVAAAVSVAAGLQAWWFLSRAEHRRHPAPAVAAVPVARAGSRADTRPDQNDALDPARGADR